MSESSFKQAQQYKSRMSVVAGFLFRSRQTHARRGKKRNEKLHQLRRENAGLRRGQSESNQRLHQKDVEVQRLRAEIARLRMEPVRIPDDPPLPYHTYGPKMISLCVNMSKAIGFRATQAALKLVMQWLSASHRVPNWTTIRGWLCRVGVAALDAPVEPADDWVWLADHSNQIGAEKILVIQGVRASKLPPAGQPLQHHDVRLLAVIPGLQWKREDVAREYTALEKRIGSPLALLTDGAVELRESAAVLGKGGKSVHLLRDFKHAAANVLRRVVGKDKQFNSFMSCVGQTRCAVQQTELAHLTPPVHKPKARFMNLAATLRWAEMVLWQLDHPQGAGRRDITEARMEAKLGWLRSFCEDVKRWSDCQSAVSRSLTFINEQALYTGAAADLKGILSDLPMEHSSGQVVEQLVQHVADAEQHLGEGIRLPMSTEILESTFGLYKALEKQHSKGGFTGLLAAFGALLHQSTPKTITEGFARVPVAAMRHWIMENLGTTLAARRRAAYAELKAAAQ